MDAVDIVARANKVKNLARAVFSSAQGQELLAELKHVYCDGKLYCNDDRDTVYFIAQRDLILELDHHTKAQKGEEIPMGKETNE